MTFAKAECLSAIGRLTPREREVLPLLAEGKLNKEIAGKLGIEVKTVEMYSHRIYRVLGVRNRIEAARVAFVSRLVK